MTGGVKRIYDGRLRAAGSQATRRRILDAARTSFPERGYRATTMKGLAAAAQVHVADAGEPGAGVAGPYGRRRSA